MGSKRDTIVADVEKLPQDDLVDLYQKLADSYRNVKSENEERKQEIHQTKQQNKTLVRTQIDLQGELENINAAHQQEIDEFVKRGNAAVESLKQKNHEVMSDKVQLESRVDELSSQLGQMQKLCEDLTVKLAEKKPLPRISDGFSRRLELENRELQEMFGELKATHDETTNANLERQRQIEELNEKILCLEDNLDSRKTELEEKNEAMEGLQEKLQELTIELAMLKSAPEDQNRKGNSLFAEVDDQRKKMITILQGERNHYLEMKKSFNAKEMEIRRLKRENNNIKQEIQICSSLFTRAEQIATESLKSHVNYLKHENRKLEDLLVETNKKLIDMAHTQNLGWIESLIPTAQTEMREMKEKLYTLMMEKTSLADSFEKNQKELAKARLDCVKMKVFCGRIVETNKINIKCKDFVDIKLEDEFLENLKVEQFEKTSDNEESEEQQSVDEGLGESTIILLGGRERLGKFVSPLRAKEVLKRQEELKKQDESKENLETDIPLEKDPMSAPVEPLKVRQQQLESTTQITSKASVLPKTDSRLPKSSIRQNGTVLTPPIQLRPPEPEKSVKFNDVTQTKVIDATQEQFEQSKQMRKRPGLVVQRIVIPSRAQKK